MQKAGRNPAGIEIKGNGQFSQNALSILLGVCSIAHTYRTVSAEVNWLSLMKCSPSKHVQFQDALWHHPTNQPILKYGIEKLDVTSFSNLVEERCIESFVIGVCISKFLDDSVENAANFSVYFPTFFYNWMNSTDKKFQQQQLRERMKHLRNVDDLQQILVPVYRPNHRGLIFVDLASA